MYCGQCGQQLSDDTRYCFSCGAAVSAASRENEAAAPESGASANQPAPGAPAASPANATSFNQPPKKKLSTSAIIGIVFACLLLVTVGALVAFLMANDHNARADRQVVLSIKAPYYDDASCSPIPIKVEGSTESGEQLQKTGYLNAAGEGLSLPPGSYHASVRALTLGEGGQIFGIPDEGWDVSFSQRSEPDTVVIFRSASPVFLTLMDPLEVTDEDLQKAADAARESGMDAGRTQELIDQATARVEQARQYEQERQAAEEAARKAEEERLAAEAEAAAARKAALTIDMPYYTVTLPDDWYDDFTIQQQDEALGTPTSANHNLAIGCTLNIKRNSTNEIMNVGCFTSQWGPQGSFTSVKLGEPSELPGWNVIVYAPEARQWSGAQDASVYAPYVTVK